MIKRRRFTADFKAKVALEALRGDKTIQEMATRHKVHPNQVSTWKRQATDGLDAVFSNGPDKARVDREGQARGHEEHERRAAAEAVEGVAPDLDELALDADVIAHTPPPGPWSCGRLPRGLRR